MLSRVADSLYWMSRYLERAEHTARLIDVHLHSMLDLSPDPASSRWVRLMDSLRVAEKLRPTLDPYHVTEVITFDPANSDSIVACIATARENARQVREQISSEMWEQLNRLYLSVIRTHIDDIWNARPHEFFWAVREGSHLFQGITDSTMNHSQGWQFIQLGRFIERANDTAILLGVYFTTLAHQTAGETDDYLSWVGLLKCLTAFEAFCKVHTADIRPDKIAEFVLLNPDFPRSIHFAARTILNALDAVAEHTEASKTGRPNRLAGRLMAALSFSQIDEIMGGGLQRYLDDIQGLCSQIHNAIQHTYIAYSADSALPA